jgi:SAM-dependent methyltransferase
MSPCTNSMSRCRDGDGMSDEMGIMEREPVDCPLCTSSEYRRRFVAQDRLVGMPGEFPVVQCEVCGFVFLNPRPTSSALSAYYPDTYYPIDEGCESAEAISVARGLLQRVEQARPGRRLRVLDVGCGTGLFLKFARDAGHDVHGIELSESAVTYGRQAYGLPIDAGTLESADLPEDSFDVVTMWHVLEHMADPIATLRIVERILKPGGLLLFGVPNIASLEARLFGRRWFSLDAPRHLIHFSPKHAAYALGHAGLRVERIDHSRGPAGLVYSLIGDLTGISLRVRGRHLSARTYQRIARLLSWLVWPVCGLAAWREQGGAIEVYAVKLPD